MSPLDMRLWRDVGSILTYHRRLCTHRPRFFPAPQVGGRRPRHSIALTLKSDVPLVREGLASWKMPEKSPEGHGRIMGLWNGKGSVCTAERCVSVLGNSRSVGRWVLTPISASSWQTEMFSSNYGLDLGMPQPYPLC